MSVSYRNIKNSASKNYTTYDLPAELPLQSVPEGTLAFVKGVTSFYVYNNGWQPIEIQNEVPVIDTAPPAAVNIPIGGSYSIDLAGTDPDGLPITWSYQVVAGSLSINTLNLSGNTFSFSALDDTSFTVRFIASDTVNEVTSDTVFTITNDPPSAPTLLSDGTLAADYVDPGTVNNYQFISVDPEGATVSYSSTVIENQDNLTNSVMTGDTLSVIADYDPEPIVFGITSNDGKYDSVTSTFTVNPPTPTWVLNSSPSYQDTIDKDPTTNQDGFNGFGTRLDLYLDRVIAGCPDSDDNPSVQFANPASVGEVFIYRFDDGTDSFVQEQKLSSPNNGTAQSRMGESVIINDDVAFVAVPGYQVGGNQVGGVEIYTRSGTTWSYDSIFTAPSTTNFGRFGYSMDFDHKNNQLIVGEDRGGTGSAGQVHIYDVSGSTVTHNATIAPTGLTYPGTSLGIVQAGFGENVAIDRGRICITAYNRFISAGTHVNENGAVLIFDYDDVSTSWEFTDVLFENSDKDRFGHRNKVGLYRDSIVISAPDYKDPADPSYTRGRVYFYDLVSGTWTLTNTVTGVTSSANLGESVAYSGYNAIVHDRNSDGTQTEKIYIYTKTGDTWASSTVRSDFLNYTIEQGYGSSLPGAAFDTRIWYNRIVTGMGDGLLRYYVADLL